jgi:RNA polymerase-binding protein DksA
VTTSATAKTAGSAAKKAPAKKGAARAPAMSALPVRPDESPWTVDEVSDVRAELDDELVRLQAEIVDAESDLAEMLIDASDTAGDDQADVGSKTFEREHEMSLANNARDMLLQVQHALQRLDDETYGTCESCGNPIGKARLQAFPRATLCLSCKQREERR